MKIKRLSLQRWMCKPESYPYDIEERGTPISKDGWYYEGGHSWFEFNGNGYTTPRLELQFNYELAELNRPKLSLEQKKALKILFKNADLCAYLRELNMYNNIEDNFRQVALLGFKRRKERANKLRGIN